MAHQVLRVKRGPKPPPVQPTKDEWREGIFIEADGTEMIVCYSGKHIPDVNVTYTSQSSLRKIGHPLIRL